MARRLAFHILALLGFVGTFGAQYAPSWLTGTQSSHQALIVRASNRVDALPRRFGQWIASGDEPLSGSALNMLRCSAAVNRTFVHSETGERITLTVLTGVAGPLVVHTPEICFSSREFEVQQSPSVEDLGEAPPTRDLLYSMVFRAKTLRADHLRVYYGWATPAGGWQAPQHPRVTLAGEPVLFKLQVGAVDAHAADDAKNICRRFLMDALPEINRCLFEEFATAPRT